MATLFQLPGEPLSDLLAWACSGEPDANIVPLSELGKQKILSHRSGSPKTPVVQQGNVWWTEPQDMLSVLLGADSLDPWLGPLGAQRDAIRAELDRLMFVRQDLHHLVAHLWARDQSCPHRWLGPTIRPRQARRTLAWRHTPQHEARIRDALSQISAPPVDSDQALLARFFDSLLQARDQLCKKG